MIVTLQYKICDVCRLIDYDTTSKPCFFCPLCSAWICENDKSNWSRRLKAAIKRRLEPGYNGQKDYPEMIQKQLDSEGITNART